MNKLAVIGLGNISNRHRRNLKTLYPNATVIAMSASGRVPEELPSDSDTVVYNIDEVINLKPDMVIVASPATLHAEHSIPLIKSGIPVLIEKPITASSSDARKIIEVIKTYQTPVAVGYCLRYLPSSKIMKETLQSNLIGNLYNVFVEVGQYLPDWRDNKNYKQSVSASSKLGGGALLELSHEIDYIQWLVDELTPKYSILRSSKELSLDVEDNVDIISLNKQGTVVSMHLDFLQRKPFRKSRFVGSTGTLEWDLINNSIVLNTKEQTKTIFSNAQWDKNEMYLNMILDFENLILGKPNECVMPLEAFNTLTFISKVKHLNVNRNQ